jgi:hypothetical protein
MVAYGLSEKGIGWIGSSISRTRPKVQPVFVTVSAPYFESLLKP